MILSMASVSLDAMRIRKMMAKDKELATDYRWKAIIVEATDEDMKTAYVYNADIVTEANPNAICGTLDAIEAKFGIPILYTSQYRALATEKTASWLSKQFTYWWLEQNNHDRTLIDTDGL
jgi:hypothetical protein